MARDAVSAGAGLHAHLVVARVAFTLDVTLTAGPGEVVAVLGPNGAGKTTALRSLAGLLPLTGGRLVLDGTPLDDPGQGGWVAPQHRPVGVVFQDYLLFPHLSARDNVAFGLRCAGVGRAAARARAQEWLGRVGLADCAGSRPSQLSGGQAQRVALARALAVAPRLLLLDEPLAALDAQTRPRVRADLGAHLAAHDGVTVLVTHDPLDAMVLADRIVVIEQGRIVQEGTPAEITGHPRTEYVARLAGLNLYAGRGRGRVVELADGFALTVADPIEGDAFVAFPPAAVALHRTRPDGSPRNVWPATVDGVEQHGDSIRVHLSGVIGVAADVTPAAASDLRLATGTPVWAVVKAAETRAYPR
ncbi:MAG TPA: ABC transporter ATP-binding protein [Micromonosporaceae bacterium]|nr:ABC transporter ATP-binding protein [Micromonosporaceae bacterium]